uniref:HTTM-like domain-containing protein n=1 Tax=Oncorhynchus tshawytscha TaxID=74940 RepID=A0A8C8GQK7_ONCTS
MLQEGHKDHQGHQPPEPLPVHPAVIQKARSVQVHQSWDRETEKQLLSQGHQTVKQPPLTLSGYCQHTVNDTDSTPLSVIFTNHLDYKYLDGAPVCRFPLFNFLQPLASMFNFHVWVFFMGAVGIMLGCFYHLYCLMFISTYWYIFFLDKKAWNNHSYLYGLIGFQLTFMGYGLRNPKKNNAQVPLWNCTLLRFQIFIVHFIAGIKKLDADWVGNISCHTWHTIGFFYPFRMILPNETVSLLFVHGGGLRLDLSVGYLLFFDATRPFGIFFVSYFHCMFAYAMLAMSPVFCYPDWPRNFFSRFPEFLMPVLWESLSVPLSAKVISQLYGLPE